MKYITNEQIENIGIAGAECIQWIKEALKAKENAFLPAKVAIKPQANVFFTSMPCLLPEERVYGLKMVSRIPGRKPALDSDLLLYDSDNGELKAFIEADWITAMRTGAVAAYTILRCAPKNYQVLSCVGLGNTCKATLDVLLPCIKRPLTIQLMEYKGQEKTIIERYKHHSNIKFVVTNKEKDFFEKADVILSCITCCDGDLSKKEWFKENVLVVPVHTLGFQNCDAYFDRVIVDDYEHVKNFKFFKEFKNLTYLNEIEELEETEFAGRIIAYNVGIALHDVYFAKKIYDLLVGKEQNN